MYLCRTDRLFLLFCNASSSPLYASYRYILPFVTKADFRSDLRYTNTCASAQYVYFTYISKSDRSEFEVQLLFYASISFHNPLLTISGCNNVSAQPHSFDMMKIAWNKSVVSKLRDWQRLCASKKFAWNQRENRTPTVATEG